MNFLRNLLQSKESEDDLGSLRSLPVLDKDGHINSHEFCTKFTEESCRTADSGSLDADASEINKGCFTSASREFFSPDRDFSSYATEGIPSKLDQHNFPNSLNKKVREAPTSIQEKLSPGNTESQVNQNKLQYNLELLDDSNFNPFQSRCVIRNSPPEQRKSLAQDIDPHSLDEENSGNPESSAPNLSPNSLKPPKSGKNLSKPKFLSRKNKRNRHRGHNSNSATKEGSNNFLIDVSCDENPEINTENTSHVQVAKESFRNSTSSDDQVFVTPEVSPLISREASPKKDSPSSIVSEPEPSLIVGKEISCEDTKPHNCSDQCNENGNALHSEQEIQNLNPKDDVEVQESQSLICIDSKNIDIDSKAVYDHINSSLVKDSKDKDFKDPISTIKDENIYNKSELENCPLPTQNNKNSACELDSTSKPCDNLPPLSHSESEISIASENFDKILGSEAQKLAEEITVCVIELNPTEEMAQPTSRRSLKIEGKNPSEESKGKLPNMNQSEAGPEIATGITPNDLECASKFYKKKSNLDDQIGRTLSSALGSQCKLADEMELSGDKSDNDFSVPPRGERSAPEGTSSPDPRSLETSEIKSSSTLMKSDEVTELLKKQELKYEEKLLHQGIEAAEKEKSLCQTLKEERKELHDTKAALEDVTSARDALLKLVEQYKGMLSSLVSEREKQHQGKDSSIKTLESEKRQALEDLANVEAAFTDVHRKYERTKQIVDALKRNEETLRGAVADYENKLQGQEHKYAELQKHAEDKIKRANLEFESLRRTNDQEMIKMAALLKKAEMKIISLQEALDRKSRENQELTKLCDELISKVGT